MSLFYLRTRNPQLLARLIAFNRVNRGIKWLDEHAPSGWWLRFFVLYGNGTYGCRAHDNYDNECALAIAFQNDATFANEFGYVTFASVLRKLRKLGHDHFSEMRLSGFERSHGFHSDVTLKDIIRHRKGESLPDGFVSSKYLDEAWADSVRRVHHDRLVTPRHYSTYDRHIDRQLSDLLRSSKRIPWWRRFGRIIPL